jgi:hypothetical protein
MAVIRELEYDKDERIPISKLSRNVEYMKLLNKTCNTNEDYLEKRPAVSFVLIMGVSKSVHKYIMDFGFTENN